jgi:hypothetical protein
VRYVLEGSVRKEEGRVRITVQLIDAQTGGHLWSERYDRDRADIFALQDELHYDCFASEVDCRGTDRYWKKERGEALRLRKNCKRCRIGQTGWNVEARELMEEVMRWTAVVGPYVTWHRPLSAR